MNGWYTNLDVSDDVLKGGDFRFDLIHLSFFRPELHSARSARVGLNV